MLLMFQEEKRQRLECSERGGGEQGGSLAFPVGLLLRGDSCGGWAGLALGSWALGTPPQPLLSPPQAVWPFPDCLPQPFT